MTALVESAQSPDAAAGAAEEVDAQSLDGWDGEDDYRPTMSVGWDASDWTVEELIAHVRMSPTQRALTQVERGLHTLPLPPGVAEDLVAVLTCATARATEADDRGSGEHGLCDAAVLDAAEAVRGVQGFADGVMVEAARLMAERAGRELLHRKGVSDPAELSST
ncbi:MAG: hypothetical protein M3R09_09295, partial [Actinomycetota bacterium]|nr:hypothetical protein [Actinomycetota bacterium]